MTTGITEIPPSNQTAKNQQTKQQTHRPKPEGAPEMQIHQAESQPYTYIVEDDNGKQLGTVDEFHPFFPHPFFNNVGYVSYTGTRFNARGMFEQKEFSGFTAALRFVGKDR